MVSAFDIGSEVSGEIEKRSERHDAVVRRYYLILTINQVLLDTARRHTHDSLADDDDCIPPPQTGRGW